jgi:hypothetical protein
MNDSTTSAGGESPIEDPPSGDHRTAIDANPAEDGSRIAVAASRPHDVAEHRDPAVKITGALRAFRGGYLVGEAAVCSATIIAVVDVVDAFGPVVPGSFLRAYLLLAVIMGTLLIAGDLMVGWPLRPISNYVAVGTLGSFVLAGGVILLDGHAAWWLYWLAGVGLGLILGGLIAAEVTHRRERRAGRTKS